MASIVDQSPNTAQAASNLFSQKNENDANVVDYSSIRNKVSTVLY